MFEIYFITSNRTKLAHVKYLAKEYDVVIYQHQKKYYGVGYKEPRISNRDKLLRESIEDAIKRWQKNISNPNKTFFFIEDTSVIIDSLSENKEYPGVNIKFWMEKNSFATVDTMLKMKGNNRRVMVRSDILLYIPGYFRNTKREKYIVFTSSMSGTITNKEYKFRTNPVYPWLDNKSFNKWFIPDGCNKPISILPISIADIYDFRNDACKKMLGYLESRNIIYKKAERYKQEIFSFTNNFIYLICGLPCARKNYIRVLFV